MWLSGVCVAAAVSVGSGVCGWNWCLLGRDCVSRSRVGDGAGVCSGAFASVVFWKFCLGLRVF